MLPDVVTPFTTPAEWYVQRERIRRAFLESLGRCPDSLSTLLERTAEASPEVTSREVTEALTRVELRYQVVGDYWTDAVLMGPAGFEQPDAPPRPLVLAIHGSNRERGKYSLMDPKSRPNRAYVTELARRGFIVVAPDQFGFGPDSRKIGQDTLFKRFFADFPDWSLDGIRLASHMRLIDLLSSPTFLTGILGAGGEGGERTAHPTRVTRVGAIGNSLGGRAVIHLAAVDERVAAAVVSTGISPNYSNVYRHIKWQGQIKSPRLTEKLSTDGIPPWDYQHLISLCAPRHVLVIEPWFDPYNPDTPGAMSCAAKAASVYRLLDRSEALKLLVHGDGHDTTDSTREYAYDFLAKGLG